MTVDPTPASGMEVKANEIWEASWNWPGAGMSEKARALMCIKEALRSAETSAAVGEVPYKGEAIEAVQRLLEQGKVFLDGDGFLKLANPRPAPVELKERARELLADALPQWLSTTLGKCLLDGEDVSGARVQVGDALRAIIAALSTVPAVDVGDFETCTERAKFVIRHVLGERALPARIALEDCIAAVRQALPASNAASDAVELLQELREIPNIMHARLQMAGQREPEYVIGQSLRNRIEATLNRRTDAGGAK